MPLMVARGYASLSFLHSAAEYISDLEVPTYIYHLGDFDPSGVNAGEKIEETLREMAPDAEIHFERLAVTPASRSKSGTCRPGRRRRPTAEGKGLRRHLRRARRDRAELLRDLVEEVIERHLPARQFAILKAAEESERDLIAGLVGSLQIGGGERQ